MTNSRKLPIKSVDEVIKSNMRESIEYEWVVLRDCLDRRYIRGMYESLDRLCKLYKKRDIQA